MNMEEKQPVLVMIQGEKPGEMWPLETTRVTTIGRSSRNTVHLLNPTVSRFHCEVAFSNGSWYLSDLNSRKGTFLNGRDVRDREILRPGDVVRISGNLLRFTDASELQEALADIDVVADDGLDPARGKALGAAAFDWKRYAGLLGVKVKGAALQLLVPALALLICFAAAFAVLGHADARVEERLDEINRRRLEAESDFEAVSERIRRLGEGVETDSRGVLEDVVRLVERHAAYPEARKAAELYGAVEMRYFQDGMETVDRLLLNDDADAAAARLRSMAGVVINPDIRRRLRTELNYLAGPAGPPDERKEEVKEDLAGDEPTWLQEEDWDPSSETPDEDELLRRMERPLLF